MSILFLQERGVGSIRLEAKRPSSRCAATRASPPSGGQWVSDDRDGLKHSRRRPAFHHHPCGEQARPARTGKARRKRAAKASGREGARPPSRRGVKHTAASTQDRCRNAPWQSAVRFNSSRLPTSGMLCGTRQCSPPFNSRTIHVHCFDCLNSVLATYLARDAHHHQEHELYLRRK